MLQEEDKASVRNLKSEDRCKFIMLHTNPSTFHPFIFEKALTIAINICWEFLAKFWYSFKNFDFLKIICESCKSFCFNNLRIPRTLISQIFFHPLFPKYFSSLISQIYFSKFYISVYNCNECLVAFEYCNGRYFFKGGWGVK